MLVTGKDGSGGDTGKDSATPSRAMPEAPSTTGRPEAKPGGGAGAMHGQQLIVGQGISLTGEIAACDRLIVEGTVKVSLTQTRAIEVTETGRFTDGKADVEEAVIGGVYEGELTVRGRLLVRASGTVTGTVRYKELEIERGGKLGGKLRAIDETD
jgi:cytoskeletal protein CcmA (bactofilin family)